MKLYESHPSVGNPDITQQGIQYEYVPDANYGDHVVNIGTIANTSFSHTIGNVLALMQKYLIDRFPNETFKTITAVTAMASKQLLHTPSQIVKRELPSLVVSPRISFGQDDNRFLGHTMINERQNNLFSTWGDGSLIPLAYDNKKGIRIHGSYNRALLYIDVVLGFNTFNEQINWMSYIYNMMPVGHPFNVRAPLELYIPMEFNKLISNVSKVEMYQNKSIYNYLTYMNSFWHHPITYKLKGGSNSDEFFMYYLTDVDVTITDVNQRPGNKDGQIWKNHDISFTMRCEFNTIGYFTLTSPHLNQYRHLKHESRDAIIPIFTDSINLDDFQLPIGWSIFGFPIFKLNLGETSISISSMFNDDLNKMLDYHLLHGIPIERFLKIQFRENGSILENERFYINWKDRVLHILDPNYARTYRLIIFISLDYLNTLTKTLYNLEGV